MWEAVNRPRVAHDGGSIPASSTRLDEIKNFHPPVQVGGLSRGTCQSFSLRPPSSAGKAFGVFIDVTATVSEIRRHVDQWRTLPNQRDWGVTPETARLLQHWRHHDFSDIQPFFCQVEAAETVIWLTEVAPGPGRSAGVF